jgi:hypothetical protein
MLRKMFFNAPKAVLCTRSSEYQTLKSLIYSEYIRRNIENEFNGDFLSLCSFSSGKANIQNIQIITLLSFNTICDSNVFNEYLKLITLFFLNMTSF